MSKKLRIALAQGNFTVGDIAGNVAKHLQMAADARDRLRADVIVFPELSLTGYPPEDLLLRKSFLQEAHLALLQLQDQIKGIHCLIGHPHQSEEGLTNACSLIFDQRIVARYSKQHLPNYGVFDEKRYFIKGELGSVVEIHGIPVGITICEDLWFKGPVQQAATLGARLILAPNASPFEIDKPKARRDILRKRAKDNAVSIVYVNSVGGQDELLFDGDSLVVNEQGEVCYAAPSFQEDLTCVEMEIQASTTKIPAAAKPARDPIALVYDALTLGLRDYVEKNHFKSVVLGLSGGVDSALALTLAIDALGKDRVHTVMMPSRYTSEISLEDAAIIAKNCGVTLETIDIEPVYQTFLSALTPSFQGKAPDITEENLQARTRGVMLMAISNKHGGLVITTGNRSELAVGYSTLYGDMVGGYAVLKDIPKMMVYDLCTYRNSIEPLIPERILTRAPSAELAPNQKDEDSLPPYAILDQIIALYIDDEKGIDEIIAAGFEAATVKKVVALIQRNEYKRRQYAPGTRVHHKAFGKDRRYPITSGFKG